jgi:toxin ParE1/3/4
MRLRYAPRARADIAEIHTYIAEHNPKAASDVVRRIREAVSNLAKHPGIGRNTPIKGARSFPVTPYSYVIYYSVRDRELIVLHIRHGARAAPAEDEL